MDFHLKQWKKQAQLESDQHFSAKIPKLHHPSPALPLFVHDHDDHHQKLTTNLSPFTDYATATPPTRFSRTGSYFSLGQWQELELQALIFRYMLAGAAVPPELLLPIKKSLLHSTPYNFLHHYQPTCMMQSGYWGRLAMDPEPGRCRRTDGKKWRCSRDVVNGHKYCERHMHRGKNRSRKPVEIPTPTATAAGAPNTSQTAVAAGNQFSLSGPSPSIDLLHFSQSSSHSKHENKVLFHKTSHNEVSGDGRSDGHVLRHFFDDWPQTVQETDPGNNASAMNSATSLSISMPGNASSDVSLKLSTGIGDESGSRNGNGELQVNWGGSGWGSNHVMTPSMGGPLAEALRSSTSSSSPTSVLHQLPRGSQPQKSVISAPENQLEYCYMKFDDKDG